ncbi:Nucleotidyltransferase domain protein [Leptospira santarosai]|uniref:Nucleotidyltransferase domain protein n=1 Tax=Leptospira santarosai TaxID=28183 RepID=A0A2P1QTD3_9LEPT|nr:Nucleotidyltransferase domain protein [Leptospira santarosai]
MNVGTITSTFVCLFVGREKAKFSADGVSNPFGFDSTVRKEIDSLLDKKRNGIELDEENRIDVLNEFIETQIRHFEEVVSDFDPAQKPDSKKMDLEFRKILNL